MPNEMTYLEKLFRFRDQVADILRHTPMDRLGAPSERIGTTLLLLSKTAGSFITGEAIYVDGGFTLMTI